MAWKRQHTLESVRVEVGLDEFSTAQLLQGLLDGKDISEDEAEFILSRSQNKGARLFPSMVVGGAPSDLDGARAELLRGRKSEAIRFIETYLGREWIGVLAP